MKLFETATIVIGKNKVKVTDENTPEIIQDSLKRVKKELKEKENEGDTIQVEEGN